MVINHLLTGMILQVPPGFDHIFAKHDFSTWQLTDPTTQHIEDPNANELAGPVGETCGAKGVGQLVTKGLISELWAPFFG